LKESKTIFAKGSENNIREPQKEWKVEMTAISLNQKVDLRGEAGAVFASIHHRKESRGREMKYKITGAGWGDIINRRSRDIR